MIGRMPRGMDHAKRRVAHNDALAISEFAVGHEARIFGRMWTR